MAALHSALPVTVFSQQRVDKDAFDTFFDLSAVDSAPPMQASSSSSQQLHHQSRASSITSPASTVINFDGGDDLQTPAKPSHEYDQYKQQTGLPSGSMTGLAGPSSSAPYNFNNIGVIGESDLSVFGSMTADASMEFDTTPSDLQSYLSPMFDDFVDPNDILAEEQPEQTIRFFPGMHQQQAQAKADAQRKQAQQQLIAQQRHQQLQQQAAAAKHIEQQQQSRSHHSRKSASNITDARTEETIARVVNQIRQNSHNDEDDFSSGGLPHVIRMKKDEEDMDEDERLLASEEGKKLSSKERRQLRNKVSARAFRSRRKEYIGQLESEINGKNSECIELRTQNRALMEENSRSQAFIERLLRHPAFQPFLEDLSRDPALVQSQSSSSGSNASPVPQAATQRQQQQLQTIPEADRKPIVGMTLVPEQHPDISMLSLEPPSDTFQVTGMDFNFNNPQVFAVTELPEHPINVEALAGKGPADLNDDESSEHSKYDHPIFNSMPALAKTNTPESVKSVEIDTSDVEDDPDFALFLSSSPRQESVKDVDACEPILGAIHPEKAFAHIELHVSNDQASQSAAIDRFESLLARTNATYERILDLTAEAAQ